MTAYGRDSIVLYVNVLSFVMVYNKDLAQQGPSLACDTHGHRVLTLFVGKKSQSFNSNCYVNLLAVVLRII